MMGRNEQSVLAKPEDIKILFTADGCIEIGGRIELTVCIGFWECK